MENNIFSSGVKYKIIEYKNIKRNIYLISEYGDIYSLKFNKILSTNKDKDGYKRISLQNMDNSRSSYRIATIVMCMFNGEPDPNMVDPTINHKDSNRLNNHYTNLEWLERHKNSSIRETKPVGESNCSAKLTEGDVLSICEKILNGELLSDISKEYGICKTTVSSIKNKKTWAHITQNYLFDKKTQMTYEERVKHKENIVKLFKQGLSPSEIVKLGYSKTTVYRYCREFGSTGSR